MVPEDQFTGRAPRRQRKALENGLEPQGHILSDPPTCLGPTFSLSPSLSRVVTYECLKVLIHSLDHRPPDPIVSIDTPGDIHY